MKRYCPNCRKEFDFTIKSMSDLDNLVCPECNAHIDRNSTKPIDSSDREHTEEAIEKTFRMLSRINYVFFAAISLFAIASYFLNWDMALYISSGICLGVFLIQLITGTCTFTTGLFFLPAGGVAGYFIFKSIRGIFLGTSIVFVVRHMLWNFFFWLMRKFIRLGNK